MMTRKERMEAVAFCGTRTPHRRVWYLDARGGENPLPPRFELFDHSPRGFEWGYGELGRTRPAVAILARVAGPKAATIFYQEFKAEFVCGWDDDFSISAADVEEWLKLKWEQLSPQRRATVRHLATAHISRVNEKRREIAAPPVSDRWPSYLNEPAGV